MLGTAQPKSSSIKTHEKQTRRTSRLCGLTCFIVLLSCIGSAAPVSIQRLHSKITDNEISPLHGNVHPAVVRGTAKDEGKVAASYKMPKMSLHFSMTEAQRADLDQLLKSQQDRRSPLYHQFLTTEQYATRFGLNASDIEKVKNWLENSGFSGLEVAHSRTWISFSGNASQAEAAFHASVHKYSLQGKVQIANSTDPYVPKALASVVESVRGLNNFAMKPHLVRQHPKFTSGPGPSHNLVPDDWATIYDVQPLYGAGLDGTGVTIAVVGQSNIHMSDIQAFRSAAGLPAKNPTVVVPPGDQVPGFETTNGDEVESDLDLEWAGGIARNADILFITASATLSNGVDSSIVFAIDNNVAPIVSISYGQCEADEPAATFQTMNALFAQANAQGMTILAASGDAGATDCDNASGQNTATHGLAVDFPSSSQYVPALGEPDSRTRIGIGTPSTTAMAARCCRIFQNYLGTTASKLPQAAAPVSLYPNQAGRLELAYRRIVARVCPDIAFTASGANGLLICHEGWCTNGFHNSAYQLDIVGGTSAGPPPFAGVLALIIQMHGVGSRLGNINPNLYLLAQISPESLPRHHLWR